ncbi:DUF928 domain-containing protein [Desulfobacterales bacterium HSG2]|nr:DUF928 domain-containing protein [Desulfobacterales bacterium HSG2]
MMKRIFIVTGLILLLTAFQGFAADQSDLQGISDIRFPVFKSVVKDAEILRRDSEGSSRGFSRSMMTRRSGELTRGLVRGTSGKRETPTIPSRMVPLVPETTGLTSKSQPALLWYVSGPCPDKMEFRVNAFKVEEPLLDTHIEGPSSEGIFRLDLAEYDVTLKPDVEYEWFLTIVLHEDDRSADYFISGTVRHKELPDDVSRRLADTPEDQRYAVYAGAGYWYDAMDHLSRQIEADPGKSVLRRHRAKLLEQVNLPKIAVYDVGK